MSITLPVELLSTRLLWALVVAVGIIVAVSLFATSALLLTLVVVPLILVLGGRLLTRAHVEVQVREQDREFEMTKGSITKLVGTFGSQWGRIRPLGDTRDIFFNTASLDESVKFPSLVVGEPVAFDEVADNVNGSHAVHVLVLPVQPEEKVRVS